MNEITKIHLGRQAFVVAVDAYKELQEYLRAIKRHMGETDEAVKEVELRMAELLVERGIVGDKVVLLEDIQYLKQQLGEPGDFGDAEDEEVEETSSLKSKRLFRDTENGMLAGVCAGIAKYLGTDPVWIRLAFVALLFVGASSVLLYIILWLIVPEAKTKSERLQMQGKPVTVDALKEVVERADVKGAATRAQRTVGKAVQSVLKVIAVLIGLSLMLAGIGALLSLITASVYWALNHDLVPANLFPVGGREVLLLGLVLVASAILSLFLLVAGVSVMKRKWSLPSWALAAIVAVFLASVAVSGALIADAAPKIRQRYEASQHTYTRTVPEFHKLEVRGSFDTSIRYEESNEYSVSMRYFGNVDTSKLKAEVKDQTLALDSNTLADTTRCQKLCLFHSPLLEITIRGPKLQAITANMQGAQLVIPDVRDQTLTVRAISSFVYFPNVAADTIRAERLADDVWSLAFSGSHEGADYPQEVSIFERTANIAAKNIDLKFEGECATSYRLNTGEFVHLSGPFETLILNGKTIGNRNELRKIQDQPGMSAEKCVTIETSSNDYDYKDPLSDADVADYDDLSIDGSR